MDNLEELQKEIVMRFILLEMEENNQITSSETNKDDFFVEYQYIYYKEIKFNDNKVIFESDGNDGGGPDIYGQYKYAKKQVEIIEDIFNQIDIYSVEIVDTDGKKYHFSIENSLSNICLGTHSPLGMATEKQISIELETYSSGKKHFKYDIDITRAILQLIDIYKK